MSMSLQSNNIITSITPDEQVQILSKKLDERLKYNLLVSPESTTDTQKLQENKTVIHSLASKSFAFTANNFFWIQNPRSKTPEDKEIPFLLWDYQEQAAKEIIKAIEEGYDLPIEKSRDLGLSWLLIAIFVWGWNFRQWDLLVGSQKFENVDTRGNIKSLLEKARYIISRSPDFLIPPLRIKETDKTGILVHPHHRATLAGESNNTNFGRSDRRKAILFDEFASWEQTDESAWQSCGSTTKCRIPLSTPNTRGTNCHFFIVTSNAHKNNRPILKLHWTLNPVFAKDSYTDDLGKIRSPWYDEQCRRATLQREVSQELDIDYEASMAGKVFANFSIETNISSEPIEYDPDLPLYVSWDFGLDTTALLWIQHDRKKNLFYVIDEYENKDADIYHYIEILESKPYKKGVHFGDPHSGENKSMTSGASNASILRRHGYVVKTKRTKILNRLAAGINLLAQVVVSPTCTLFIEALKSWQFVKPKTGNTQSQTTAHNEYSHICESYTYFAYGMTVLYPSSKQKVKRKFSPSISGVT